MMVFIESFYLQYQRCLCSFSLALYFELIHNEHCVSRKNISVLGRHNFVFIFA
jgi:hypothetical protein